MKNFPQSKILIVFAVVLVATLGFFLMNGAGPDSPLKDTQSAAVLLGEGHVKFTHPERSFSLEYPKELKVEHFEEDLPEGVKGETILFQHKDDAPEDPVAEKTGFQIFIVPFQTQVGETAELTRERILKDVPSAEINDPLPVIINPDAPAGSRIEGLLFWSVDGRGNRTREVWFIHEGYLYEITTYAHLDTWLGKILSSWRLK